ncbi:MAG: leucine-rich repeat protein, partial [Treponema sp.]|nr:leucine-rich repeat protein [Treponema sp.]
TEIQPVDGDWKFDFEGYYYGFGTAKSGGKRWTIRNGLMNALDRLGSIGGALLVRFGNGNGFSDGELSDISGRITLSDGGAGIGATVRLIKLEQQGSILVASPFLEVPGGAGANGTYTIEGVLPGTYVVEAELSGYEKGQGDIFAAEGGTLRDKDVTLQRPSTISGMVTKSDTSSSVDGLMVYLTGKTTPGNVDVSESVMVTNGSYSISGLLPGTYTITISLSGYVTDTRTVTVAASGLDVTQNLALQRLSTISGTVTLIGGGPGALSQAKVTLSGTPTGGSAMSKEVSPNGTGDYVISDLLPGIYTITGSLDGYGTNTINTVTVDTTGDDVTGKNLTLTRQTYTVTFNLNNGSGNLQDQSKLYGEDISLPDWGNDITAAPTPGEDLIGWNDGSGDYAPGDSYTVAGNVTLTAQWGPFTSAQAVEDYLDSTGTAGTITAPIPLTVEILSSEWGHLLTTLGNEMEYVALDLSGSDMGTTFDPGSANTGKQWIVSLTLPTAAQSIPDGTISAPAFQYFTALKNIEGAYIETIGDSAFDSCSTLSSVNFPAATSIGSGAFFFCRALKSVDLPVATSIGYDAFAACDELSSVYLPMATSIGDSAFWTCVRLTSVDLPQAISISDSAFSDCIALESVSIPAVTSIGGSAFSRSPLLTIIINGGCSIADNEIHDDFKTYYTTNGSAGGTYIFTGGAWTGPF